MKRIYMDNGATSFPKAPNVAEAVYKYMTENGCNVNRSSYENAGEAEDILLDTRYLLCQLFDFDKPSAFVAVVVRTPVNASRGSMSPLRFFVLFVFMVSLL